MKKTIVLGTLLCSAIFVYGIVTNIEQEITFKIPVSKVNYIAQSFNDIKTSLASSSLPANQFVAISNTLDSCSKILQKGVQRPEMEIPGILLHGDTTKKKKK